MTREISIVTPVGGSHAGLLAEARDSIRAQAVPAGWTMRWYVQEDGPASSVRDVLAPLGGSVVDYSASGSPGGAGEARNLALARSRGEIVMLLDADDVLLDGAVARVVEALESGGMWCGFGALDDRDGRRTGRTGGYSLRLGTRAVAPAEADGFVVSDWEGDVGRGRLRECWERFAVLPFHPATFAAHSRLIWEVGGWPALARDEDTALILAVSDRHPGVVSREPNIAYRRHADQTSRLVAPLDERVEFIRRLGRRDVAGIGGPTS